jgi:DNA-binding HxlR family transcriptional regulator
VPTVHESIYVVQQAIAKRWISEILMSINESNHHYSELLSNIPDISSRELRRKLKLLCKYGLIVCALHHKGYYLTPLGEDVIDLIISVSKLSVKLIEAKTK